MECDEMRTYGTQAIGIRMPIIHEGDNLIDIVTANVLAYAKESGQPLCNGDVVGITEAIVARAQGNIATTAQIAKAVRAKFPSGSVGVVFPILSRNRFAILLKGIAAGAEKLYIQLSYPADEVGNHLISVNKIFDTGVNPYKDVFDEPAFRTKFGASTHEFTGVDYISLYRELGTCGNIPAEIIIANDPCEMLKYTKNIIAADIHTREQTKKRLKDNGGDVVIGLDDLLTESMDGSGFNPDYGLLGSNKATEERVKLFPHSCQPFVTAVQRKLREQSGADVEVMIYGDGAFKDPVGKIWELADPVVSPAFTPGLAGLTNEIKLKYLADNEFANMRGEEAATAIAERIRGKGNTLVGKDESLGTTPRYITDFIGTLCDLVSGSGDKGTPVVLIRGYFDNYASE